MEIALKMAFRTYMSNNPWSEQRSLEVVGLEDGYHGDTLGCMDAVAPSVYNGPRQTPWYCSSFRCPSPSLYRRCRAVMQALQIEQNSRAYTQCC